MPYSKKEVERCRSALDLCSLENRPCAWPGVWWKTEQEERFDAWWKKVLEQMTGVVLQGLRKYLGFAKGRLRRDLETAEHARTSGVWGSSADEMVARFEGLAAKERKTVREFETLITKIEADGLPPQLLEYRGPC